MQGTVKCAHTENSGDGRITTLLKAVIKRSENTKTTLTPFFKTDKKPEIPPVK
jgi:hypothetical protein